MTSPMPANSNAAATASTAGPTPVMPPPPGPQPPSPPPKRDPSAPEGTPANPFYEVNLAGPAPTDADYAPGKRPCSVLVLTKNEEVNIEQCLSTLTFSDDIVVLDSFSTDRTCELSRKFPNVRLVQRKFDTWSRHSNWALDNIQFKHPWVYYSDADERITPELREELFRRVNNPDEPHVAFRLKYKNMFLGQWIRRGGLYPVWIIRLYRPDKIRYEDREVNAHPVVQGSLGDLDSDFIHYSFNKGLNPWFTKHNSYSDMESKEAVRVIDAGSFWDRIRKLFNREPGIARRALKDLSFYIPLRAFARFMYMYFARLAVLDGRAGFHYACMISVYEYWIELKIRERRRAWKKRTEDTVLRMLGNPSADHRIAAEEVIARHAAMAIGAAPAVSPTTPHANPGPTASGVFSRSGDAAAGGGR